MKTKLILLVVIIFTIFSSCKNSKEEGIGYSEFINTKELTESVVSKYPNGQKKAVVFFEKGDINQSIVKEVHFFENGKIQVEGTLKNKERHGVWTFYHNNGKVWSTGEFDMGKSVGVFEIYTKEGVIKVKSYYENNKKVREDYFSNGEFQESVDL